MTAWTDKKFSTLAGYMGKLKLSELFGIINMWSYYKPTDGSTYGITPASISLSSLTSNYNKAWTRNAVAASHKRLSKFSSYNHTMAAPVSAFSVTGSPYTSSAGGDSVTFTADVNLAAATAGRVDLGDVLGSGFYFAVRCIGAETHTARCSTSISDGGKQITFNTSGWTAGSYACYPFITNSDYSVCYSMPNVSSDSITVTQYVAPAPTVTGIVISGYGGAVDIGESVQLHVYLTYSDGTTGSTDVASANIWSGYSSCFNLSGTGTFTGKAVGSCNIVATYMGYTAQVYQATVFRSLQSLTISGYTAVSVNGSFTLSVTANYSDGSHVPLSSGYTWDHYNANVVTRQGDTFTAVHTGTTNIYVYYGGVSAYQAVSVSAALTGLTATGPSGSVHVGDSFAIRVYATYYDGTSWSTQEVPSYNSITWSNYSGFLSRNGNTFTATAVGARFVDASYGGYTAHIGITVVAAVKYVTAVQLSSSSMTINVGDQVLLSAIITPSDANTWESWSWTSSMRKFVTVEADADDTFADITGVKVGSSIITFEVVSNGVTYSDTCRVMVQESGGAAI